MSALKEIMIASRRLLRTWRALALMAATYASLLAALALFVAMKEARLWQVLLTLVFAALAPALFYLLQAMMVNYASGEARASVLLRRSFGDSCKLALASVSLILLAVPFLYFLNKLQTYFPAHVPPVQPARGAWSWQPLQPSVSTPEQLQWSLLVFNTIRFLFCGFVLPLVAIHMWSATLRGGLLSALKSMQHHLSRVFAPEVVQLYTTGLMLFGLIPYVLLFMHTPASRPSVEIGLFTARLLLAFIFTLCGWAVTLDAVTRARAADVARERQVEAEAM
jgi:hypothetical protein